MRQFLLGFNSITLLLAASGGSCLMLASLFLWKEIGEIDRRLSDGEQFSWFWIPVNELNRISREYKRLYPNGHTNYVRVFFTAAGFVFIALAAIADRYSQH